MQTFGVKKADLLFGLSMQKVTMKFEKRCRPFQNFVFEVAKVLLRQEVKQGVGVITLFLPVPYFLEINVKRFLIYWKCEPDCKLILHKK